MSMSFECWQMNVWKVKEHHITCKASKIGTIDYNKNCHIRE